jgi:flagellar hook assembly protein FlgD
VTGRLVRSLVHGDREAGHHTFTWAGDDDARRPVAPGVYYARLTVRGGPRFTRAFVHL